MWIYAHTREILPVGDRASLEVYLSVKLASRGHAPRIKRDCRRPAEVGQLAPKQVARWRGLPRRPGREASGACGWSAPAWPSLVLAKQCIELATAVVLCCGRDLPMGISWLMEGTLIAKCLAKWHDNIQYTRKVDTCQVSKKMLLYRLYFRFLTTKKPFKLSLEGLCGL